MSQPAPESYNPYARPAEAVLEPPKGFRQTLRFLGPSFILIGSIVGAGELILTTSFGAQVGFVGLWFILLACVCKTIIQAELGRYTISSGDTCLQAFNRLPGPRFKVSWFIWLYALFQIVGLINGGAILGSTGQVLSVAFPFLSQDKWALLIAAVNILILLKGRYAFLEKASVFMVITFSGITVAGAVALQCTERAVPASEALLGLVPLIGPLVAPAVLATTVAAFAGTGVSGGELMAYTYWCVEKGYARYTGEAEPSESWVRRARGWIRVMQIDVWLATAVFTSTTIAFFWLGAGILKPAGQAPSDSQMIVTLQQIYTGSLGQWAASLFLVGAFFVLYSTVFSGTAGASRLYADLLGVFKIVDFSDFDRRMKWIRFFIVAVPVVQAITFSMHAKPQTVLTLTAAFNGMLIPIIAFSTVWLRRHGTDKRIAPNWITDVLLVVCSLLVLTVSLVYVYFQFAPR